MLILDPSEDEWEVGDRNHQERNELQELLRWLCQWSQKHDLTWDLSVDRTVYGRIDGGACLGLGAEVRRTTARRHAADLTCEAS
jgi:hypothetical protein